MNLRPDIFKKSLLFLIFLILFLPIIQNKFNLFKVSELKGYFDKVPDIKFSYEDWTSNIFQETKTVYLNETFGLRNTLTRLNNQLRFNLFKKTSSAEAVFGKDGYFFGSTYLRSYNGEDFIGVKEILHKCRLVKELQDSLQNHGQIFLPVLAPSKVRVLHDFLPADNLKKNASNYEVYVALFKKLNIKYIDFNAYFTEAVKTSKYPLYTKYGTHWSAYGHTLAADSIINYLNYNYKLNTPTMVWKNNITLSDSLREPDYDIVDGMNLLTDQLPSFKTAYPTVTYTNTENNKPSLFVIGDSFNFGLERSGYNYNAFSDYKFLYYFKQVFPSNGDNTAIYKLKLKDEITNHKVILLVTAEFNLSEFGWGFLEKATALLNGKLSVKQLEYENSIHLMEFNVVKDPKWFAQVKQQAIDQKIKLDSMIYLNAKYLIDQQALGK